MRRSVAARRTLPLLARLFVRRLLDTDIIAPGSDRHESLAVAFGILITVSLFLSVALASKYLTEFIQLPGTTAHRLISDRFFLITVDMATTALTTLLTWDALGLERSDGAILGPLPVTVRIIASAKLTALLALAAAFSLAFGAGSSAVYSVVMAQNLHPPGTVFLRIVVAQALTMTAASAFAFLAVLAIRVTLQALLTDRWFERLSAIGQAVMITAVLSALLLLPFGKVDAPNNWTREGAPRFVRLLPPLWFVGLESMIEGHSVADLPVFVPARSQLAPWLKRQNERDRASYRQRDSAFPPLAASATRGLALTALVALAGYVWNNRRLRLPVMWPVRRGRVRAEVTRWTLSRITPLPTQRAGFSFALSVLARSAPHRVAISAALGVGVSAAVVLARSDWNGVGSLRFGAPVPIGLLAVPLAVTTALVAGFRHAVALPAELPANWTFQMAWSGDRQAFLAGCRRAALAALIVAPLVILLPLYGFLLGVPLAMTHAVCTELAAQGLLEAVLMGVAIVPFASPYKPMEHPRVMWPASFFGLFGGPFLFATVARSAYAATDSTLLFLAALVSSIAALKFAGRWRQRNLPAISFEPVPEASTQQLGLRERLMG